MLHLQYMHAHTDTLTDAHLHTGLQHSSLITVCHLVSKGRLVVIKTHYSIRIFCQLAFSLSGRLQKVTKDKWAMLFVWGTTPWPVYAQSHVSFGFKEKNVYVWLQSPAIVNPFLTVCITVLIKFLRTGLLSSEDPTKKDLNETW